MLFAFAGEAGGRLGGAWGGVGARGPAGERLASLGAAEEGPAALEGEVVGFRGRQALQHDRLEEDPAQRRIQVGL